MKKSFKVYDPINARAIVAELIARGGQIKDFPPNMTDTDWLLVANQIVETFQFDRKENNSINSVLEAPVLQ